MFISIFLFTHGALKFKFSGVPGHVASQHISCHESFVTNFAVVSVILWMRFFMQLESVEIGEYFTAD